MTHYWYPEEKLGKKYVLSRGIEPKMGQGAIEYIPGCDNFALMFTTCDYFNCNMHNRTWPHKHLHADHCFANFANKFSLLSAVLETYLPSVALYLSCL